MEGGKEDRTTQLQGGPDRDLESSTTTSSSPPPPPRASIAAERTNLLGVEEGGEEAYYEPPPPSHQEAPLTSSSASSNGLLPDEDEVWSNSGLVYGGAFWEQSMMQESPVDVILGRDDIASDEERLRLLLLEDRILQEATAGSERLLQFLARPPVVMAMLDYLTLAPGSPRNGNEGTTSPTANVPIGFPFLCCEILCINVEPISRVVLSPEGLARFFQILNQPPPISPRLAGYFRKVLASLLLRDARTVLTFAGTHKYPSPTPITVQEEEVSVTTVSSQREVPSSSVIARKKIVQAEIDSEAASASRNEEEEEEEEEEELDATRVNEDRSSFVVVQNTTSTPAPTTLSLSAIASSPDTRRDVAGLLPLFLNHIESYSIAGCITNLIEAGSAAGDETWNGGRGTALAILEVTFAENTSPVAQVNASELLIELFRRNAASRFGPVLPVSGIHLNNSNSLIAPQQPAPNGNIKYASTSAAGESGNLEDSEDDDEDEDENEDARWTTKCVRSLVRMAFPPETEGSGVEASSVAALRVLSQVVVFYSTWKRVTPPREIGAVLECLEGAAQTLMASPEEDDEHKEEEEDDDDDLESRTYLLTQFGTRIRRFGMRRLLVAELLTNLVLSAYPRVAHAVAASASNPLARMLDAFFEYQWNNILHTLVERCVRAVLVGDVPMIARKLAESQQERQAENFARGVLEDDPRKQAKVLRRERERVRRNVKPLQEVLFSASSSTTSTTATTTTRRGGDLLSRLMDACDGNNAVIEEAEERYHRVVGEDVEEGEEEGVPQHSFTLRHGQTGYMGHVYEMISLCVDSLKTNAERATGIAGDDDSDEEEGDDDGDDAEETDERGGGDAGVVIEREASSSTSSGGRGEEEGDVVPGSWRGDASKRRMARHSAGNVIRSVLNNDPDLLTRWNEFLSTEFAELQAMKGRPLWGGRNAGNNNASSSTGFGSGASGASSSLFASSSPNARKIAGEMDDDELDEEEEEEDDEDDEEEGMSEETMRLYGFRRDPLTGALVSIAATSSSASSSSSRNVNGYGTNARDDDDEEEEEEDEEEDDDDDDDFGFPRKDEEEGERLDFVVAPPAAKNSGDKDDKWVADFEDDEEDDVEPRRKREENDMGQEEEGKGDPPSPVVDVEFNDGNIGHHGVKKSSSWVPDVEDLEVV